MEMKRAFFAYQIILLMIIGYRFYYKMTKGLPILTI